MHLLIPALTRVIAALVALAMIAIGCLAIVEVVANWLGNGYVILPTDWPDQLRATAWDAAIVRTSLVLALLVGLVLLFVGLWPRPPLTIETGRQGVRLERRAVETCLRRRLESLDGVGRSRVRVNRSRIRATIDTSRRIAPESVRDRAVQELAEFCELHELRLNPDVSLRHQGSR